MDFSEIWQYYWALQVNNRKQGIAFWKSPFGPKTGYFTLNCTQNLIHLFLRIHSTDFFEILYNDIWKNLKEHFLASKWEIFIIHWGNNLVHLVVGIHIEDISVVLHYYWVLLVVKVTIVNINSFWMQNGTFLLQIGPKTLYTFLWECSLQIFFEILKEDGYYK